MINQLIEDFAGREVAHSLLTTEDLFYNAVGDCAKSVLSLQTQTKEGRLKAITTRSDTQSITTYMRKVPFLQAIAHAYRRSLKETTPIFGDGLMARIAAGFETIMKRSLRLTYRVATTTEMYGSTGEVLAHQTLFHPALNEEGLNLVKGPRGLTTGMEVFTVVHHPNNPEIIIANVRSQIAPGMDYSTVQGIGASLLLLDKERNLQLCHLHEGVIRSEDDQINHRNLADRVTRALTGRNN